MRGGCRGLLLYEHILQQTIYLGQENVCLLDGGYGGIDLDKTILFQALIYSLVDEWTKVEFSEICDFLFYFKHTRTWK